MFTFVYFSFRLAHLALQMENILQRIMQLKWQKNKNEVDKICNEAHEPSIYMVSIETGHFPFTSCQEIDKMLAVQKATYYQIDF